MPRLSAFLPLLGGLTALAGCNVHIDGKLSSSGVQGSGVVKTESRSVSGFHAIQLNGVGTLKITQDGKESVSISAEDNLLPLLQSKVENGTLTLGPEKDMSPTRSIDYDVHVKDLSSLALSGAGIIDATGLSGDKLAVNVSGAGSLTLAGKVNDVAVTLSGAGSYDGKKLESKSASVESSGAGLATVDASDSLNASISGMGKIEYTGSPRVTQNVSGLGSVSHIN